MSISLKEALQSCKSGMKRNYGMMVESESNFLAQQSRSSRKKHSVVEMSYNNTSIIKIFPNVQDAAKEFNVSSSTIYAACAKNRQVRGKTLKYFHDLPIKEDKLISSKVIKNKKYTNKKKLD